MKTKFTLVSLLICAFFTSRAQQVPNGNFATWTDAYAPTSWTSYEEIIPQIQGIGLIHKDSVDTYNGSQYSVELTTQYVSLASQSVGATLGIGTGIFNGQSPHIYGIPFTFSPDTLQFAYKYAPVGADTAAVQMALIKAGDSSQYKLGITDFMIGTDGQWEVVTIPLRSLYSDTTGTSDTLLLDFVSSALQADTAPVGSVLHIDGVRFGYQTAPTLVEEINKDLTTTLLPNPAKDHLEFRLSEVQYNASIMVFDMTGRVLTHEFVDGSNFDLNTSRWSSGIYTYSLISNGIVVNKGKFVIER